MKGVTWLFRVAWSEADGAYVASRTGSWPLAAHGDTPLQAMRELVTALELEAAHPPLVARTTYVEEPHAACDGRGCEECGGSGMWRREVET